MAAWTEGYTSEIPYLYMHIIEQSPRLIDFALLRNGYIPPQQSAGMTYCELGCGYGYTTNLLAACYPEMEFHAVDFNPAHIAAARDLAEEAGLENVRFYDASFLEYLEREDIPQFDYISAHGVWSWVSREVRGHIMRIVEEKLRAGGAFYVSYNALPGSAAFLPLQKFYSEMHRFVPGDNLAKITNLMTFTDSFFEKEPDFCRKNPKVPGRHEFVKKQSPAYFVHEYLNENWESSFFSDVCKDLEPARVTFAGSSDLMIMMLWADIEEKYAELLAHISDPILQEQVKDYIIDTTFRKDIFVRGARRMNAREMLDRITSTRLAILGSAESFDSKIEAYGRSIKLDKNNHHASLLKQLEKGPCTIKSLHQHKILGELPISGLFNLICCCISQGHIAPLREAEEVTGIESAKRFNKAIIRRTRTGEDFDWLAAPEIGYGIHCPRAHRIFYDAIKQGRDPVDEMVTTCKLLGQGLVKDGESVTDIDEAIIELKGAADRFRKRRYKYLDRAGIAA